MKTRHLFTMTALAGAIMMTSCDNESHLNSQEDATDVKFTGSLGYGNSATRASGTAWDAGDEIGIFMYRKVIDGHKIKNEYLDNNKKYYTPNGLEDFQANLEDKIILTSNSSVAFFAYYPWDNGMMDPSKKYPFDIALEQTSENQPNFDYLWADATNSGFGYPKTHQKPVEFYFKHRLAMLEINLKAGDGVNIEQIKAGEVKITNVPTSGTFVPEKGHVEVSNNPNKNDITMRQFEKDNWDSAFDAILLPSSNNCTKPVVEITVNETTYKYVITNKLKSGEKNILDIIVSRNSLSVIGIIEDWKTGEPVAEELFPS